MLESCSYAAYREYEVSIKLIGEGTHVSYEDMLAKVKNQQVLVVTWRHPARNNAPRVKRITNMGEFTTIIGFAKDDVYTHLRWFASTGSLKPGDYGMSS